MSSTSSNPQITTIEPGTLVGRYRIEHTLGSGGMADVFYAIHEDLKRPAAIKILKASLAADETNLRRFMNEARSAAALIHPNIVQVYDVGRDSDLQYIAQEFIPGANLRQYLADESAGPESGQEDRQLGISEVLSIVLQVLAALKKSSASGIVHRDIKPENIMLTKDGEVKVADFGLARTLFGDDPKLTRAGTTLGTPMYMSPEQIQGQEVDVRSDLYSLGVTIYHMVAGRPPFTGDTQLALAMMHTQGEVPDITGFRQDIPTSIKSLVTQLLEKSPEDRFKNPEQVLEFIREHRNRDLQDVWPEQTIPLPRASEVGHQPSLQATMELQALLRERRSVKGSPKWLTIALTCLALFACFAVGFLLNRSKPIEIQENDLFGGVLRMENAEAQVDFALANDQLTASRVDKWRAVERYFPKEEPDTQNRYYVGMASIHLARALQRRGDSAKAIQALDDTINDPQMDEFIRAHALINKAILVEVDKKGKLAEDELRAMIDEYVETGHQILLNIKGQREDLQKQLDALVDISNEAEFTQQAWKGRQN